MEANEIRNRIAKAEEAISKKQNLIEKRFAQAEKKVKELNGLGLFEMAYQKDVGFLKEQGRNAYNFYHESWKGKSDEEFYAKGPEWKDFYYGVCKLQELADSIRDACKAVEEKKALIAKYEAQLAKEEARLDAINSYPQVFLDFMDEVVEMWDAWDAMRKASVIEARQDVGRIEVEMDKVRLGNPLARSRDIPEWVELEEARKEIRSRYSESEWYDLPYKNEEQIHASNVKDAQILVQNLFVRVSDIVGDVEDASDLHIARGNEGHAVINGLVKGQGKVAKVQSVGAGGWNIQRFHIRTLVNEVRA